MATLFCEMLFHYQKAGKMQVHEFVVMPNHFHLLMTIPAGMTLERAMQYIKGGFSYQARKQFGITGEIWQTSFLDRRVRDRSEYGRCRNYIHQNPVRAGLVEEAIAFVYSSASMRDDLSPLPQWLKPQGEEAAVMQA